MNTCQAACREDNPCGALDPSPPNATLTSTSVPAPTATVGDGAASTNAAGTVYNGLGGAAATDPASTDNKSGAQSALDLGRSYGLAAVFAGIFAGFAFFM